MNTGIYSPAADQVAISTGGTQRLNADTAAITSTLPVVHPLGAVGTPSITFTGDLNTGIFSPGADTLALVTAGSNRLHITSAGLVGIGTTSGTALLQVNAQASASGNAFRSSHRIADSGTGVTLSGQAAPYISYCHGLNSASNVTAIAINGEDFAGGNSGVQLEFNYLKSSGAVASGDRLGRIAFGGDDATNLINAAAIEAWVDGTPGTNDMPGRLVFSTTADGSASPTERFRIGSAGQLGIGGATYGTSGQVLTSGGASAAPTWSTPGGGITSGTAVASTSGTSIDFTGIPAGVKRVTVMFNGVSTNGSSYYLVQLGTSGSPTTTGYTAVCIRTWSSNQVSAHSSTSGFVLGSDQSGFVWSGALVFNNISGNIWILSGLIGSVAVTGMAMQAAGNITLGGVLNMLRITTVNGTDTFDAGSINIMYQS